MEVLRRTHVNLENVLSLRSGDGDGNAQEERAAGSVLVRQRVADSTRPSFLYPPEPDSGSGRVRPVLRDELREFLSCSSGAAVAGSGPVFPDHVYRVFPRDL